MNDCHSINKYNDVDSSDWRCFVIDADDLIPSHENDVNDGSNGDS